jgi:hypothetical protein
MSNRPSELTAQEIAEFMTAFRDFMVYADEEIDAYKKREEARKYIEQEIEQKAAEMEVTVNYYMEEFM